jgi:peptidyl-prolyl cis-trans isomerase D
MLQTIREHTQGWIAGIIITILILSFALWGIHSYLIGGGSNNTNVAEVNGIDITKEQLALAYERLRRQVQIQYGTNNPITTKDETVLKDKALQALVDIEVLKQSSAKEGFRVSGRQIDNYLHNMPEFQVDGQFSIERFQEILSSTLLSTSEFLEIIRTTLLIDQPKLGIVFTSFALPEETSYTISLVNQEREIEYLNIPLQIFLSQPIVISPQQIQAYYNKHQSNFMTPEQVNIEYVELSIKELSKTIVPTDAMLKAFYNENINAYTLPMQWKFAVFEIPLPASATQADIADAKNKASSIVEVLRQNQTIDLANVAKEYSANLINQDWIALNQVLPELQKTVSELRPGEVSGSFRTSKGLQVIKVIDIEQPKMQTFEVVKGKVKESYVRQYAETKFAEIRERLADATYEHPDSLLFASKALDMPIKSTELFSQSKGSNDISSYKKVRDVAFSNDVINLKNNSDVIQLNQDTAIVLRVKSHVPPTLLPLKNIISKKIEDKLKAEEAESRLAKFASDFREKLQSGDGPLQLADNYHLKWVKPGFMGRYSTKVDSAILDLAFRLPASEGPSKNKSFYGITRLPIGYAIVSVKSIRPGTITDKKQFDVFREQFQASEGLLEYQLYKQSQMNNAKIDIKARD